MVLHRATLYDVGLGNEKHSFWWKASILSCFLKPHVVPKWCIVSLHMTACYALNHIKVPSCLISTFVHETILVGVYVDLTWFWSQKFFSWWFWYKYPSYTQPLQAAITHF